MLTTVNIPTWRDLHSAASLLYEAGFTIIPLIHNDKKPARNWKPYQTQRNTPSEIYSWWSHKNADAPHGVAVVLGLVGNHAVLDFDPHNGHTVQDLIIDAETNLNHKFPDTTRVETCGFGYHDYYTISATVRTVTIYQSKYGTIQLRGEGAYVVAPPTTAHSSRTNQIGQYTFLSPLSQRIAFEQTWLFDFIQNLHTTNTTSTTYTTNTTSTTDAAPDESAVHQILEQHKFNIGQKAYNILFGHAIAVDRSAQVYSLACELARSGITDPKILATLIYATPSHKDKFGNRPQGTTWDAWNHAQVLAQKVLLNGVAQPSIVVPTHSEQAVQPAQPAHPTQPTPKLDLTFPRHAAMGICADIAKLHTEHTESPFEYWYVAALTCLGNAVSGAITIDTAYTPQPRLYTVIVGPSGMGRKSASINTTVKFMQSALADLDTFNISHGVGSAEGLANVMSKGDGTLSRLLLLFDELRVFIRKAKSENSVLMDMVGTLFEINHYSNATKTSVIKLPNAHLSMLSATTEDMFTDMWSQEFMSQGFINRLVIVPGEPTHPVDLPESIPANKTAELTNKLHSLVENINLRSSTTVTIGKTAVKLPGSEPRKLILTDTARRLWRAWYYDWFNNNKDDSCKNRLDVLAMRFMILNEISRGNTESIESDTIQNITDLMRWQHNVRKAYAPTIAGNTAATLESVIQKTLRTKGMLSKKDLYNLKNINYYGLRTFQDAINALLLHGIIQEIFVSNISTKDNPVYELKS